MDEHGEVDRRVDRCVVDNIVTAERYTIVSLVVWAPRRRGICQSAPDDGEESSKTAFSRRSANSSSTIANRGYCISMLLSEN